MQWSYLLKFRKVNEKFKNEIITDDTELMHEISALPDNSEGYPAVSQYKEE